MRAGGSPKASTVARCTASKVRTGSTGKRRPARASTPPVMLTISQRRAKTCSPCAAARSCSWLNLPPTRALTIARADSASVRADVMRFVAVRIEVLAAASPQATHSIRCSIPPAQRVSSSRSLAENWSGVLELPYSSPRSLSIKIAAVPCGSRISGQSSSGSPLSRASRIMPAAARPSNCLRPSRDIAGGTSSATTRPCEVTAMRSPASIRRIYRLRLFFNSRMPVSVILI